MHIHMCVCVCVGVCVCVCVCVFRRLDMIQTRILAYLYVCVFTYLYVDTNAYMCVCPLTCFCMFKYFKLLAPAGRGSRSGLRRSSRALAAFVASDVVATRAWITSSQPGNLQGVRDCATRARMQSWPSAVALAAAVTRRRDADGGPLPP